MNIDEDLWERFREDVIQRRGGTRGYLREELESAIREYIHATEGGDTHDRLRRLENRQQEMMDILEGVRGEIQSSAVGKNKKISDLSTEVENKLASVVEELASEGTKVDKETVERCIREGAGVHSDPSIRDYKGHLLNDRVIFPHPTRDSIFFTDAGDFAMAVASMVEGGKVSLDRYDELVDRYGEEMFEPHMSEREESEERPCPICGEERPLTESYPSGSVGAVCADCGEDANQQEAES